MPKELMDCVKSVKKSGKDESSAYGICSKSTGWRRGKKGSWKNKKSGKTFHESSMFDQFVSEILNKPS